MDWNDNISGSDTELVSPGDYWLVCKGYDRTKTKKLPPQNMAVVYFFVGNEERKLGEFRTNIVLADNLEWKIRAFFRCFGLLKHKQEIPMPWDKIQGAIGCASVKHHEYDGKTYNDIDKFEDPGDDPTIPEWAVTAADKLKGDAAEPESDDDMPF